MNGNNGCKGWGLSLQKQFIFTNGRDKGWGLSLQKQLMRQRMGVIPAEAINETKDVGYPRRNNLSSQIVETRDGVSLYASHAYAS